MEKIITLLARGLTIAEALIEAGETAEPAVKALAAIATGATDGSVTDQQLADAEALLDQLIEEFNLEV